jgi:ribosome-binding factor A
VGSLLQETLAELIAQELNDPRLGLWTITSVRTSPDLGYADIAISTLAGGEATETAVKVLNKAAPLLWNRVRTMTDLRTIPKLRFNVDRGGEYLDEISHLIEQLPPAAEDYGPEAAASAGEDE